VTRVEVQETPHPVAGIFIGFESDSVIGEPANYPLTVANTMASGFAYPTGYLHETLRGRGLVYMVHAQNWPGRDADRPGVFMVLAGCEPGRVNEVVELILENIARLQSEDEADLVPGWFERAKQLIITNDALQKETASDQAMQAALDELYGLGYDRHERFAERIEAVELEQVRQAVRGRLVRAVVTVSTPQPEAVQVEAGERRYDAFHPVDLTPRGVEHAPVGGPG
jgi:zinc protease